MTSIYKVPFAATGDKDALAVTDPGTGKVSLQTGFTADYEKPAGDPTRRPVGRREFNGILNEVTAALGEVQQYGFAKWTAITGGWPLGARVENAGTVYISTLASNTATPGVPGSNWDVALGTAAARNTGTGAGDVPTNADLGAAAFRAVGVASVSDVPALSNIQNGTVNPKSIGSFTFNATTNTITATGNWTPSLYLDIGDVIQVAGTASNNKVFTVESVISSSIVVNAAHANGAGPLSLVAETSAGTASITRLAKWYTAPLGVGQAWVNVQAVRASGVNYAPPGNRSIQVQLTSDVDTGTTSASGFVNGALVTDSSADQDYAGGFSTVSFIVPAGSATYKGTAFANGVPWIRTWTELR